MLDLEQAIARAETLWPHMAAHVVRTTLEALGASEMVAQDAVSAVLARQVAHEAGVE